MAAIYTAFLTWVWARYPCLSLDVCRGVFGETFTVSLASGQKISVVSAPSHVEQLFKSSAVAGNEELRPYLGEGSLFLRKGAEHREARQWMNASILTSISPTTFAAHMAAAAALAMAEAQPCDLYVVLRAAALRSGLEACFGRAVSSERVARLIEQLFVEMTSYKLFSYRGVITDEFAAKALHEVRAELAALIEACAEAEVAEVFATAAQSNAKTREQAVDDVLTFIAAGTEPLAATLAWALCFLSSDRSLEERVDAEVSDWAPAECPAGAKPSLCAAVIDETLRLMPVVPVVDRVVTVPTSIAGRLFHNGDRVAASAYLTHRRPDIFTNPRSFDPERFLSRSFSPYEYYPFGGGIRRCIGASSAARLLLSGLKALRSDFSIRVLGNPAPTMYNVIVAPRAWVLIAPREKTFQF